MVETTPHPDATPRSPAILSIQSAVAYGHVGNSAAVFPLQRLGFEVWPIDTVQFSNHPGYGAFRGRVFEAGLVTELVTGMEERGVLASCAAVLSGYLGEPATGAAVLDAVARVKAGNPAALYCCDPVIGDSGPGIYVRPGLLDFFRDRGVPAADLLTPNRFELEQLTGRSLPTLDAVAAACAEVLERGPRRILVTSLERADAPEEAVEMLAADTGAAYLVQTPRLDLAVNGAGDAVSALFLAYTLSGNDTAAALGATAAAIFAVLEATKRAGARELALVAAQDALVAPPRRFAVARVG